jgi:predicted transcriptional regulator
MSTNTTTPTTPTTASTADTDDDRSDAGQGTRTTTAGDRLWAALHARPGGTTEQLSGDAGIGRSTAAKILARWVTDGTVERTTVSDGKKSGASRFAIATPTDPAGVDAAPGPSAAPNAPMNGTDGAESQSPASVDVSSADGTDDEAADRSGQRHHPEPPTVADPATTAAALEPDAQKPEQSLMADSGIVVDEPAPKAADTPTTRPPAPADAVPARATVIGPTTTSKAVRLRPGALLGMVEDYLREHAGEEFGPTTIGRDLGRSSGAVSNALERLVSAGYAVQTKDRPKRYALAAGETTRSATDEQGG